MRAAFHLTGVNLYILHKTTKYRPSYFVYFNTPRAFSCSVQRLRHMHSAVAARACTVCRTHAAHLPHAAAKPFSARKHGNSQQKPRVSFDLNQFICLLYKNVT